jgi:hypothetical protein
VNTDRVKQRRKQREQVRARLIQQANYDALRLTRTARCVQETIAGIPWNKHSCTDDGSTCLCECHDDPKEHT